VNAKEREELLRTAVRQIADRCPRIVAQCYWAGTSAIALEETGHRESFDLDFHSQHALADTRPLLAELQRAFPRRVEVVQAPDALGSGFSAVVELEAGAKLTVQVFAAFDDVPDEDIVRSSIAPGLRRVALHRYLADKVQCIVERIEARDLVDISAVVRKRPLGRVLRRAVAAQDSLLMAERLLGWTDGAIRDDLRAYRDVDPAVAVAMRDELLALLRTARDDEA
jgi:hypothetical protein